MKILNHRDRKPDRERQRWQKNQQTTGQRGRKAKIGTRSRTERDGEGKRHGLQGREREDLKDGGREPVRQRWRKMLYRKKKITAEKYTSSPAKRQSMRKKKGGPGSSTKDQRKQEMNRKEARAVKYTMKKPATAGKTKGYREKEKERGREIRKQGHGAARKGAERKRTPGNRPETLWRQKKRERE